MEQLMFLRGARILQQLAELYEDSTVPDLEQNIQQAFPTTKKRQHATGEVTIQNVQYLPYVGTKFLHVKSSSQSGGHAYEQKMQFTQVQFEPADSPNNVTVKAMTGQDAHMKPISLSSHNCKVKCTCLDFYYRFATHNAGDNSLVGRAPPPYQKKTNRPPVNPGQVPGMCKHLLKLVQELQQAGLVLQS